MFVLNSMFDLYRCFCEMVSEKNTREAKNEVVVRVKIRMKTLNISARPNWIPLQGHEVNAGDSFTSSHGAFLFYIFSNCELSDDHGHRHVNR